MVKICAAPCAGSASTINDIRAIEEACIRFDLSPLDEEFLIQHCAERLREEMPTRRS
ncbi:hypothetical protein H2136_13385 [Aeromonas hydrophila]|uniref:Uncharacterized protein n=1 Tax=Aeromonas hydrophila TaxID=644 RepID=A0A926FNE6_AERHY|nr:hypothetical protein [Aeromonas hydrophila]